MPYEGEQPLSPIELQARGLMPPGPLSPKMNPNTPTVNEQAISDQAVKNVQQAIQPKGLDLMGQGLQQTGMGTQSQLIGQDPFNPTAKEVLPGAAGMGAAMLIPGSKPFLGPLMRAGASGIASGLTSKLLGGDFSGPAIMSGLTQGVAELPFMAARQAYNQKRGPLMLSQQEEKQNFNKAMAGAITGAEQAGHEAEVTRLGQQYKTDLATAKAEHKSGIAATEQANQAKMAEFAEKGATYVADEFQNAVPAWKGMGTGTKGLLDMVYGKGQERLSQSFDKALKEVVSQGKGKNVPIPIEDVTALGIEPKTLVPVPRGMPIQAEVDAGDLSQALVGRWKKDPQLYRRGFAALDKAGLGNETARNEYRNGQALISFLDKSGALERTPDGAIFHPEKVAEGLTKLKKVDELRKRGAGDALRGPLAESVNLQKPELSQAPSLREVKRPEMPPEPMPTFPPKLPDLGITQRNMGPWERRIIGAGAGEVGGLLTGHPWGGGVIGGALGDLAIPRTLYGNVPMGPLGRGITTKGPALTAEILRLMQSGMKDRNE